MKHQLASSNDDETFCRRSPNETSTTTSRLPPSAPPPSYPMVDYTMVHPPPYNFAHHIYDAIEPKSQHKWMFCAAVFELFFGLLAWSIAITCAVVPSLQVYFPLYTGCWTTSFYVINAIIGIIAAKRGTPNFFVAHIVFSVLSIVCSVILATLSIINWYNAGIKDIVQNFCIVSKFDQAAFRLLWHQDKYDYDYCLYSFKLGVTMNMILVLFAIVLGKFHSYILIAFYRKCHSNISVRS